MKKEKYIDESIYLIRKIKYNHTLLLNDKITPLLICYISQTDGKKELRA